MKRREKADMAGLQVTFEAVAGRQGGRGIFVIEDEAEEIARRTTAVSALWAVAEVQRGTGAGIGV